VWWWCGLGIFLYAFWDWWWERIFIFVRSTKKNAMVEEKTVKNA